MQNGALNLLMASSTDTSQCIQLALDSHFTDFHVHRVETRDALTEALGEKQWSLLFSEMSLTDFSANELPEIFDAHGLSIPVILIADNNTVREVSHCLEHGICALVQCDKKYLHYLPVTVNALLKQAELERKQAIARQDLLDSEERFLDIFNNTSDLIQCIAPDGSFIYTNNAWRKAMGYTVLEVAALNLMDVLHPESQLCCQDRFERLKLGIPLPTIDFKFLTKSGETLHLIGECGSILKDGVATSTRGIFQNVTEQILAEKALKESEARFQALYDLAPDIYTTLNTKGEILSVNQTGLDMLGYSKQEIIGYPAIEFVHPEDRQRVSKHIEEVFLTGDDRVKIEYRKTRKDGSVLWIHECVKLDEDGGVPRLLVVCRDITVQRELQEKLKFHATHDSLTQLINRRELENRLQRVLSTMTIRDEHILCFLDLDEFKMINDANGHAAGDDLLRQITKILHENIRSRDTLARIGGDEFIVLMERCPLEVALKLAEKFKKIISEFEFRWRSQ
ncbi:MAG TPA: PAS domain S-box protein, partial [Gammaproteobacteria bacterium]|nr:PAS domain S-box protein [Gammaproteobacteria bacterium]